MSIGIPFTRVGYGLRRTGPRTVKVKFLAVQRSPSGLGLPTNWPPAEEAHGEPMLLLQNSVSIRVAGKQGQDEMRATEEHDKEQGSE